MANRLILCTALAATVLLASLKAAEPPNLALDPDATITGSAGTLDPKTVLFDPAKNDYLTKTDHNLYGYKGEAGTGAISHPSAALFLRTVKGYADFLIQHGRDTYGVVHSPLFTSALNPATKAPFESSPPSIAGIRGEDRAVAGANPMHSQDLYQVLYALSVLTGETTYAQEADTSLTYFFKHCQSPTSGLFAWGEHMSWDFYTDKVTDQYNNQTVHEFYGPWTLWDKSYQLAPEACNTFAQGLWDHQVYNKETGHFSRHCYNSFAEARAAGGAEFPRHGGFYILSWAKSYQASQNAEMLTAIRVLLNYFKSVTHPETGLIPATAEQGQTTCWPASSISLATDLWTAADLVPSDLGKEMKDIAGDIDDAILKYAMGPGTPVGAFIVDMDCRNGQPIANTDLTGLWPAGYTTQSHSTFVMRAAERFDQVEKAGYRTWILNTANTYVGTRPDVGNSLHPTAVASTILLMNKAYRLTQDQKYLDYTTQLCEQSILWFFRPGSDLPMATGSGNNFYESISGGDTLMMALLDTYCEIVKPNNQPTFTWTTR